MWIIYSEMRSSRDPQGTVKGGLGERELSLEEDMEVRHGDCDELEPLSPGI